MPALESHIEGLADPLWTTSFVLHPLDGIVAAEGDELTTDGQRHLLLEVRRSRRMRAPGFRLVSVCGRRFADSWSWRAAEGGGHSTTSKS